MLSKDNIKDTLVQHHPPSSQAGQNSSSDNKNVEDVTYPNHSDVE